MVRVFKRSGRPRWHFKLKLPNGTWETRTGYVDKRATETLAAEEQARIDRGDVGLVDPFEKTRTTPLTRL